MSETTYRNILNKKQLTHDLVAELRLWWINGGTFSELNQRFHDKGFHISCKPQLVYKWCDLLFPQIAPYEPMTEEKIRKLPPERQVIELMWDKILRGVRGIDTNKGFPLKAMATFALMVVKMASAQANLDRLENESIRIKERYHQVLTRAKDEIMKEARQQLASNPELCERLQDVFDRSLEQRAELHDGFSFEDDESVNEGTPSSTLN